MIIGLTGPVGAGKNAAAKILRRRGAYIIDVDQVAHTLYEPQSEVWREMVKALGSKILKRGGEINRKKLGEIVFSDKKRLQQLNSIVHPRLKDEIVKIVESRTLNVEHRIIVINAAVLKEIGLIDFCDEVWVVMASRETRFKRLMKTLIPTAISPPRLKVWLKD